jgi:hypothetical protein
MLGREGSDIDGGTESLGGTVEVGVSGTGVKGVALIWRQGKGWEGHSMERDGANGV